MSISQQATKFAPPERASEQDVVEANKKISLTPFLVNTLDQMPLMVFFLNKERQIVFANRLVAEVLGLKDDRMWLGRRPGELLQCVHSDEEPGGCGTAEACRTCGGVNAVLAAQEGKNAVREARIITKMSGQSLDLRIWATPFQLIGDNFTLAAVMDISDEKRRRILERIFFHDIFNTIGGLLGYTELLEETTSEEKEDYIRSIRQLSLRLLDEIKSQRELTLAESGDLSLQLSEVSTADLLQEIVAFYRKHEVAEGKSLQIAETSQDVSLTTDRTILGRVLGNMVKNALEFTPPGKTVIVQGYATEDTVEFTVYNPGVMPRDVQLQVFQKSFSTKGAGRGLGTYSIRLLSEQYLGGKVTFTSTEEDGTTFIASYPKEKETVV